MTAIFRMDPRDFDRYLAELQQLDPNHAGAQALRSLIATVGV